MDHCYTCKVEIRAEDIVVSCEGFCEDRRYFHAKCVGLSYDEGCACLHRNVFWMCDSCRNAIEYRCYEKKPQSAETSELATKKEVECLKAEVEKINEKMSQIASNCVRPVQTMFHNHSESSASSSSASSSPLSSTKINAKDQPPATLNKSCLSLYISNIANDVSGDEVAQMVCEAIGSKEVFSVKCLVSPWKNISTMDYVSFKVVIDAQYRNSALVNSNWPIGVRCREFRDHSSLAWRPPNRTNQLLTM